MSWEIEISSEYCFFIEESPHDITLLVCGLKSSNNYGKECLEKLCPLRPTNSILIEEKGE